MNRKWDLKFLRDALNTATLSKDPKHKVGAIITIDNQIVSDGFNGFPRGFVDLDTLYEDGDMKYKFMVHAENNAIINAGRMGRSVIGGTIYVTRNPCVWCSLDIIQSGIKRVVYINTEGCRCSKWEFADALKAFDQTNVSVVEYFKADFT